MATSSDPKEDMIRAFMAMTGESREFVESFIDGFLKRFDDLPVENIMDDPDDADIEPWLNLEPYPHFLPAESVQKYTLRITLRHIKPAIWRKVEVPSNISLRHLAELVIELMGWENEHLHQFVVGSRRNTFFEPSHQRRSSFEAIDFSGINHCNQEDFAIAEVLSEKGKSILFEYDFGDGWEHDIKLSSIAEYAEGEDKIVRFVGGKRACPPEDCGGIWGYEEICRIAAKKAARKRLSRDERERLEWYSNDESGKTYDPEYFDPVECQLTAEDFSE